MENPLLTWDDGAHEDLGLIKVTLETHQYEIVGSIGSGSFAGVYSIRSLRYHQEFVAKVSRHNGLGCPKDATEISALSSIVHPYVVAIYDAFLDNKFLYIILEYCRGGSLETLVSGLGLLVPPRLYTVCLQLADALLECHRKQIAHQDIKPTNVLLDRWERPKLADFGLSHQFSDGFLTRGMVGSFGYMAPEVMSGCCHDASLSDVWSLGVTFYYISVGALPWAAESCIKLESIIRSGMCPNPTTLAPGFRTLLRKMMTVDVNIRPSLEWVIDQLNALIQKGVAEQAKQDRIRSKLPLLNASFLIPPSPNTRGPLLNTVCRRVSLRTSQRAETFETNIGK
jgi:serine/threonine protein kinase